MRKGILAFFLVLALVVSAIGVKLTIDSYESRNQRSEAVRLAYESLMSHIEEESEEPSEDLPVIEVQASLQRFEVPEFEPYEAITLGDFNVRNYSGDIIATTLPGDTVEVLRPCGPDRITVRYNGLEGSILPRVLPAKGVAICINELNLRDENGDVIVLIPQGELVVPLERINLSNERTLVRWNGKIGTVLTEGLQVSFVLIDIDNQYVAMYLEGDHLISGKIVTGNESTGHGTPRGLHYLLDKQKDVYLSGPDWNVKVEWWMPFAYEGRLGMHNADHYRSEYGGDIYKTAGSHGCVNMPNIIAETIYDNIWVGFPIVVK